MWLQNFEGDGSRNEKYKLKEIFIMNIEKKTEFLRVYKKDGGNTIYNYDAWKKEFPDKLYRYRPLRDNAENEFHALENDKVWAAVADKFPDEFRHTYKIKGIGNDVDKLVIEKMVSAFIEHKGDVDKAIEVAFDGKNSDLYKENMEVIKYAKIILSNIPKNREVLRSKTIKKDVEKLLLNGKETKITGKMGEFIRKDMALTCFTDISNCSHMWEKFAGTHNGFCALYDFDKMIKNGNYVLPIHYTDDTQELEYDELFKICFYKITEFCEESEWRMLNKNDGKEGKLVDIVTPDEIICGSKVDVANEAKLRQICEKKGIKFSKES